MDTIVATVLVVCVTLVAALAVSGLVFAVLGGSRDAPGVAVTGVALVATDFTSGGTGDTFTCTSGVSGSYLKLSNTGTGSAFVEGVVLTWAGGSSGFTPVGSCPIDASGSPTSNTYLEFTPGARMAVDAVEGQAFTGTVTLSDGAQLLLTGTWA